MDGFDAASSGNIWQSRVLINRTDTELVEPSCSPYPSISIDNTESFDGDSLLPTSILLGDIWQSRVLIERTDTELVEPSCSPCPSMSFDDMEGFDGASSLPTSIRRNDTWQSRDLIERTDTTRAMPACSPCPSMSTDNMEDFDGACPSISIDDMEGLDGASLLPNSILRNDTWQSRDIIERTNTSMAEPNCSPCPSTSIDNMEGFDGASLLPNSILRNDTWQSRDIIERTDTSMAEPNCSPCPSTSIDNMEDFDGACPSISIDNMEAYDGASSSRTDEAAAVTCEESASSLPNSIMRNATFNSRDFIERSDTSMTEVGTPWATASKDSIQSSNEFGTLSSRTERVLDDLMGINNCNTSSSSLSSYDKDDLPMDKMDKEEPTNILVETMKFQKVKLQQNFSENSIIVGDSNQLKIDNGEDRGVIKTLTPTTTKNLGRVPLNI